ncbi:hypothetical protein OIU74_003930 [Salix koriyanagi]|uniref:Uncharacterized protein n=1 Tax=Salix koriyanagi TaxID=2511006 RepID=A0A9Q0UYY2_9ROSI|nr:hypothetical protein OIU74_003930 [Salix koriyanagi]
MISPTASSVDSSSADESDDGESSSYAGSSSSGDTFDSEPVSPPHNPWCSLAWLLCKVPSRGLFPTALWCNLARLLCRILSAGSPPSLSPHSS